MRSESEYQAKLIKRIQAKLPGCFVLKNDPSETQGIPDLLVLYQDSWAMLEVKRSVKEEQQPNQAYYVDEFDGMSFAAFVYPENEGDVLDALQAAFGVKR